MRDKNRRAHSTAFSCYVSSDTMGTAILVLDPSGQVATFLSGCSPFIIRASTPAAPLCAGLPGQGLRRLIGLLNIQYPHFLQKITFLTAILAWDGCIF